MAKPLNEEQTKSMPGQVFGYGSRDQDWDLVWYSHDIGLVVMTCEDLDDTIEKFCIQLPTCFCTYEYKYVLILFAATIDGSIHSYASRILTGILLMIERIYHFKCHHQHYR